MDHGKGNPYCCFHPKVKIVGVCAPCLKERLLILAAKKRHHKSQHERRPSKISKLYQLPTNSLPKVFALGSLLHRFEIRSHKQENLSYDSDGSASNDDSFISIKFENNGAASWDKGRHSSWATANIFEAVPSKPTLQTDIKVKKSCMVELGRSRTPKLRWRKRIGHILQLVRWRRSNKGSKVEVVNGKKGWTKPITKRNIVGE